MILPFVTFMFIFNILIFKKIGERKQRGEKHSWNNAILHHQGFWKEESSDKGTIGKLDDTLAYWARWSKTQGVFFLMILCSNNRDEQFYTVISNALFPL